MVLVRLSGILAADPLEGLDVERPENAINRAVVHAEDSQLARERNGVSIGPKQP